LANKQWQYIVSWLYLIMSIEIWYVWIQWVKGMKVNKSDSPCYMFQIERVHFIRSLLFYDFY
jgi:hypothetical protein